MVKTLVCFHEVLGFNHWWMHAYISFTNVIYKHIHHGEYTNMEIMLKWCPKKLLTKLKGEKDLISFTTCKFVHGVSWQKCNLWFHNPKKKPKKWRKRKWWLKKTHLEFFLKMIFSQCFYNMLITNFFFSNFMTCW